MNSVNENEPYILIAKYLSGEATAEEAIILNEWLDVQENKEEYAAISSMWQKLPASAHKKQFNSIHAWEKLESFFSIPQTRSKSINRSFYYLAAACMIAVVVGGFTFFLINRNNNKDKSEIALTTLQKSSTDQSLTHVLPDGSNVTLNKNSLIRFPANFKSNRSLLIQGEAYFTVAHDKNNPFVVIIDDLKVEVVGTSFNINKQLAEQKVTVQVQSGTVKMYTAHKEIYVTKGHIGVYSKQTRELQLIEGLDVNSISYATKSFLFRDLSFSEVAAYLENAFNVDIEYNESEFSGCRITAEFANKPLPYILDIISITLNSNYKQKGRNIIIKGKGC